MISLRGLSITDSNPFRGRVLALPTDGFDVVALAVLNKTNIVAEKKGKIDWWAYRVSSSLEVVLKTSSEMLMFWCVLMPLRVSCVVCLAPMRYKTYNASSGGLERYAPEVPAYRRAAGAEDWTAGIGEAIGYL